MRKTIQKIADDLDNFRYRKSETFSNGMRTFELYKKDVLIQLGVDIKTNYKIMKLLISYREIKNFEEGEVAYLVEKINKMGDNLLKKYNENVKLIIENRLLETVKI